MSVSRNPQKMPIVQVRRPRIRSTAVTTTGKVVNKRISLVSPYSEPIFRKETKDVVNPVYLVSTQADDQLFDVSGVRTCPWKQVEDDLWRVYHESNAPNQAVCCIQDCQAHLDDNLIRCEDCGPFAFYCKPCCDKVHGGNLQLHKPKIWTDAGYKQYHMDILLDRPYHTCNTKSARSGLLVYDEKGRIHHCTLVRCQCEREESLTLMRHNLWSASVKEPKVAFHMELMKWLEFLLIESSVSLQSACLAIRWKNGFSDSEYNSLYNHLVGEPIQEYLMFQNRLRDFPVTRKEDFKGGPACPACPEEVWAMCCKLVKIEIGNQGATGALAQDKGEMFISLDANFGLVRKQNGGNSQFGPRHGARLFVPQADIDSFVKGSTDKPPTSKDCNSFQAGSVVRSKNKSVKLDQKGVFGAACRHGIPKIMMSMTEGERLAYPIFTLNSLLDQVTGSEVKLHVLYDIACMLDSHIKKNQQTDKYASISLALPIFHAYGHKSSCQIRYSCRWLDGFGLTDGEVMERLWSFLRPFSKSTKEMTPSHRIDRLTDALLHYSRKKRHEIDALLCRNIEKAKYLDNCCTQELETIKWTHKVSEQNIKEWLKCEQQRATTESSTRRPSGVCDTKRELLSKLRAQSVEYVFMSTLRRKYSAIGQAIANRISRSITKIAKNMRKLLALYNQESTNTEEQLEWKQVSNPEAAIFKELDNADQIPNSLCGREVRQKAVDLYLHRARSREEIVLSKEEMMNCLRWYAAQISCMTDTINTSTSRGEMDLVFQQRSVFVASFQRAKSLFSDYVPEADFPVCAMYSADNSAISKVVVMEEDLIDNLDQDDIDGMEDNLLS